MNRTNTLDEKHHKKSFRLYDASLEEIIHEYLPTRNEYDTFLYHFPRHYPRTLSSIFASADHVNELSDIITKDKIGREVNEEWYKDENKRLQKRLMDSMRDYMKNIIEWLDMQVHE